MTEVTDWPVFHVEPRGPLANRMIQDMVALTFQSRIGIIPTALRDFRCPRCVAWLAVHNLPGS